MTSLTKNSMIAYTYLRDKPYIPGGTTSTIGSRNEARIHPPTTMKGSINPPAYM